jgi:hypothetical protein
MMKTRNTTITNIRPAGLNEQGEVHQVVTVVGGSGGQLLITS